jgi:hypothetical protein
MVHCEALPWHSPGEAKKNRKYLYSPPVAPSKFNIYSYTNLFSGAEHRRRGFPHHEIMVFA